MRFYDLTNDPYTVLIKNIDNKPLYTPTQMSEWKIGLESCGDTLFDIGKEFDTVSADYDTYSNIKSITLESNNNVISTTACKTIDTLLDSIYNRYNIPARFRKKYYTHTTIANEGYKVSLEEDDDDASKDRGFFGGIWHAIKTLWYAIWNTIKKLWKWLFGPKDEDINKTQDKFKQIQDLQNNAGGGGNTTNNNTTINQSQTNINNTTIINGKNDNSDQIAQNNGSRDVGPIKNGRYLVSLNNYLRNVMVTNKGRKLEYKDNAIVQMNFINESHYTLAKAYHKYKEIFDVGAVKDAVSICNDLLRQCEKNKNSQNNNADATTLNSRSGNNDTSRGSVTSNIINAFKNIWDNDTEYNKLFAKIERIAKSNNKAVDETLSILSNIVTPNGGALTKAKFKEYRHLLNADKVVQIYTVVKDTSDENKGQIVIGNDVRLAVPDDMIEEFTDLDVVMESKNVAKEIGVTIEKSLEDTNNELSKIDKIIGDAGKVGASILKEIGNILSTILNNYKNITGVLISEPNKYYVAGLDQVSNEILDQWKKYEDAENE